MSDKMTQSERRELASLIKRRAKLDKQKAKAYGEQLIANADAEMNRRFKLEDLGIKKIAEQATAEVEKVRAVMNAQLDAMGVAKELRPDIKVSTWAGGYYGKDHRADLRRKARVEVNAAVERRITEIDVWEVDALTEITAAGLTTDAARSLLESLPGTAEALPAVEDVLGPVEEQPLAIIENKHEAKRHAVLRALTNDDSRSDREIGRLLGVDHKTVGRVRAERGDISAQDGDFPTTDEEIPRSGDVS